MDTVGAGGEVVRQEDVTVTVLGGDTGVDRAIALLDRAESRAEGPLVDEAERSRLRALAAGTADDRAAHWHPLLATEDDEPTGYAGIVLPAGGTGTARSDLAPDRRRASSATTVSALFAGLTEIGRRHGTRRLHVWIRHATDEDESCARAVGFGIERRLVVTGRELSGLPDPEVPAGVTIRPFEPGSDAAEVVRVLGEAYEGTPDGGWDRQRFDERRAYDWFDPADLLVAEDADGLAGLHWTKRRGVGVGEVYNLAVADRARGTGLGRALLLAGLQHLAGRGCEEAILWVDRSNEPAVELYRSAGFTDRWVDVAFGRDLA